MNICIFSASDASAFGSSILPPLDEKHSQVSTLLRGVSLNSVTSLMCGKSWGLVTAAPSSFQTLSLLNNEFISNHPWFYLSLVRNVEEAWNRKKGLCADKLKTARSAVCLAGLTEKINILFLKWKTDCLWLKKLCDYVWKHLDILCYEKKSGWIPLI